MNPNGYGPKTLARANTSDEAIKLIEAGFEFVTDEYNDGANSSERENENTLPKRKSTHLRL